MVQELDLEFRLTKFMRDKGLCKLMVENKERVAEKESLVLLAGLQDN